MNTSNTSKRDELLDFYQWYGGRFGYGIPPCVFNGFSKVGQFTGLVLYRSKPFQVQLWLCEPNSEIHDHAHLNVDSIQVYLAGQVYLRLNGQPVLTPEKLAALPNDVANANGRWIRVKPTDNHGATIGPLGGAFMTFQHWLNGVEPRSVETDWDGKPLDDKHDELLFAYSTKERMTQIGNGLPAVE